MAVLQPTSANVPFDPEIFLALSQEYSTEKNLLVTSGALAFDQELYDIAMANAGKITRASWLYDFKDADYWDGQHNTEVDSIGHKEQTSVIVRKYKIWGWNELTRYMTRGKSPEVAINDIVTEHKNTSLKRCMLSMLKGNFANSEVAKQLVYDISTKSMTTADYIKAKTKFWGDMANSASLVIMHAVVYANLMTQLTETQMVNFLNGATVLVDDSITAGTDNVYETYILRNGAIRWTGDLPLRNAGAFVEKDQQKNQGEEYIGYRRAFLFEPVGLSFKGTLAKPITAQNSELETGTNWEMVLEPKKIGIAMIKSKEVLDGTVATQATTSSKKVEG